MPHIDPSYKFTVIIMDGARVKAKFAVNEAGAIVIERACNQVGQKL